MSLSSLHVDEEPGDRASDCGGIMEPVAVWYVRAAMDGCGKPQPKTKRPLCRRIALRHSGFFATYGNDSDYIPCTIKLTRNSWIFSGCFFFYCTNRQKQRRQLRTQQRWKCLKKLSNIVLLYTKYSNRYTHHKTYTV